MARRIYISEHKQKVQALGFEIARAKQQFGNAYDWYCGTPMEQHLDAMAESLEKLRQAVVRLREIHANYEPQMSSLHDPERDV